MPEQDPKKKVCSECDNKGKIRLFWAEDQSELIPCPKCYPDNPTTKDAMKRWYDRSFLDLDDY
jgi:Zn ribbon nucleic-acid-binding protein